MTGKMKHFNVDETGISMSGKTAIAIIATIVTTLLTLVGYAASLATKEDVTAHNGNGEAHQIALDEDGDGKVDEDKPKPVAEHLANHEKYRQDYLTGFTNVKNEVGKNTKAIGEVKDTQHEAAATTVAYRAVDQMPSSTPSRRKIQRFEQVKSRAKRNLKAERPIHEGIESAAF
jgi:hypothetical protein